MAKNSYCQVLRAELWGFEERRVEQRVLTGLCTLRLVPTESWGDILTSVCKFNAEFSEWLQRSPCRGWRQCLSTEGYKITSFMSYFPDCFSLWDGARNHSYGCFLCRKCLHLSSGVSLHSQWSCTGNYIRVDVVLQSCERIQGPLGQVWVDLGAALLTSDSEEKLNFLNWHIEVFGHYHVERAFGVAVGSTCWNFCFPNS